MIYVLIILVGEIFRVKYKWCLICLKFSEVLIVVNKVFILLFMIWNGVYYIEKDKFSKIVMFVVIVEKRKK